MTDLILALNAHKEANNNRYLAAQTRIFESLEDMNNTPPNVDKYGRYHAPYEGYMGLNGELYNKGVYIPMPEMEDVFYGSSYKFKTNYKTRIQAKGSLLEELKEFDVNELFGIRFGIGKNFQFKGFNTAYIYVEAVTIGFFNIFEKWFNERNQVIENEIKEIEEAKHALKGTVPEGKERVKGKVISVKFYDSDFYYGTGSLKMLVELENKSTVWGTVPSAIADVARGDLVEFTATFNHSDDKTHAFFKRPSKAVILETAKSEEE